MASLGVGSFGLRRVEADLDSRAGSGTELTASVANLLDKRYVEALTAADNIYQGERRRVLLTLSHRW